MCIVWACINDFSSYIKYFCRRVHIELLVPRPLPKFAMWDHSYDNADASQLSVNMCATDFPTQKQAAVLLETHNTLCDCNTARKQGMYVKTT